MIDSPSTNALTRLGEEATMGKLTEKELSAWLRMKEPIAGNRTATA
jgi:hypothetical protein